MDYKNKMMKYICPDCGTIVSVLNHQEKAPKCPMAYHSSSGQHKMVKVLLEGLKMGNPSISMIDLRLIHKRLNK